MAGGDLGSTRPGSRIGRPIVLSTRRLQQRNGLESLDRCPHPDASLPGQAMAVVEDRGKIRREDGKMSFDAQRRFFLELFSRDRFPPHGVRVDVEGITDSRVLAHGGIEERAQMGRQAFEFDCASLETIGDDRVPMLHIWSGTEVFAAAYGSPVHRPADGMPFALPAVFSAEEADRLEEPDVIGGSFRFPSTWPTTATSSTTSPS
jgi:hypothetical protein